MGGLMQAPTCCLAPVADEPMGSMPISFLQTGQLKPRGDQGLV